jgi:hypothetical protein
MRQGLTKGYISVMKVKDVRIGNLIAARDGHYNVHRVSAINGNRIRYIAIMRLNGPKKAVTSFISVGFKIQLIGRLLISLNR